MESRQANLRATPANKSLPNRPKEQNKRPLQEPSPAVLDQAEEIQSLRSEVQNWTKAFHPQRRDSASESPNLREIPSTSSMDIEGYF